MKKLFAMVLALMLALTVTGAAMATAADITGEAGVIGEFETPDVATEQGSPLTIYKEITAYNPETCEVNAPAVTFSYTIGAATVADGTTITDNASRHAKINNTDVTATVAVKAGVGTPTITGTADGTLQLVPGTDKLNASENGTANRFPLSVSFSGIDFTETPGTGAGVYRYVINETTTQDTKYASGIKEGSGANTLYLDVYVDGTGKIYGYVLFTNNASIDGSTNEATAATSAGKVEGFVGSKPDDGTYDSEDDSTADKYYTFNLEVAKVVVNDSYISSTKHQFPFTVILANSQVTAQVLPIMTVSENATQTALSAFVIGTTIWQPTIADGAKVTYVGIPAGTQVSIYEKNDVIGTSYTSVSANADTDADAKVINTNDESNTAIVNCGSTPIAKATENHTATSSKGMVTFTNTLLQISPTGYVARIAPYALMLGAGIFLLVIFLKNRKKDDEEAEEA